jgi:hypothetical protein
MRKGFTIALQPAVTKAASFLGETFVSRRLPGYREMIVTLDITSAERDDADETYDLYIITGDGKSEWDLVHFPQIATTGAKRFTARVLSEILPQNVTTAAPGVAAVDSGTLATITGGTNAAKSLAAGSVRHGPWGDRIRSELVVAGTVTTGIAYSIQVEFQ